MEIVPLKRPATSAAIAAKCDEIAARARDGEFAEVLFLAVRPDGSWMTNKVGDFDPLRVIGMLHSAIADILSHHETTTSG